MWGVGVTVGTLNRGPASPPAATRLQQRLQRRILRRQQYLQRLNGAVNVVDEAVRPLRALIDGVAVDARVAVWPPRRPHSRVHVQGTDLPHAVLNITGLLVVPQLHLEDAEAATAQDELRDRGRLDVGARREAKLTERCNEGVSPHHNTRETAKQQAATVRWQEKGPKGDARDSAHAHGCVTEALTRAVRCQCFDALVTDLNTPAQQQPTELLTALCNARVQAIGRARKPGTGDLHTAAHLRRTWGEDTDSPLTKITVHNRNCYRVYRQCVRLCEWV